MWAAQGEQSVARADKRLASVREVAAADSTWSWTWRAASSAGVETNLSTV